MAQISYWKQVNILYNWYEYVKDEEKILDPTIDQERDILKKSISLLIDNDKPYMDINDIYARVLILKNIYNITIEDALIKMGEQWYNDE
jgi:hypothetical protein